MDSSTSITSNKQEIIKSQIHINNHMLSFINSMSLKCALQLGLFDAIHSHGKPITFPHLAQALSITSQKARFLPQLMRILVHSGYLFTSNSINNIDNEYTDDDEEGQTFSLTSIALLLLQNHPFTIRPQLLAMLDPNLERPWHSLSEWYRNNDQPENQTPFAFSSSGITLYEYAKQAPEFGTTFNEAMAGDSRLTASILLEDNSPLFTKLGKPEGFLCGFDSLVDVGGGTGELARAIALAYPNMRCTVLDLPQVVSGLKGTHNLSFVAGDMFMDVPHANAVLLKRLLRDWNDEDAIKILEQCRKAITSDKNSSAGERKAMIIDIVLRDDDEQTKDYIFEETQLFYDMEEMVIRNGKQRREKEWKKLFEEAGFTGGYKIYHILGLMSLIEVYP